MIVTLLDCLILTQGASVSPKSSTVLDKNPSMDHGTQGGLRGAMRPRTDAGLAPKAPAHLAKDRRGWRQPLDLQELSKRRRTVTRLLLTDA